MNSALGHLLLAGSRESIRHPETIFWTFVFPILLAFALGIAFRGERPDPAAAVVVDLPGAADGRRGGPGHPRGPSRLPVRPDPARQPARPGAGGQDPPARGGAHRPAARVGQPRHGPRRPLHRLSRPGTARDEPDGRRALGDRVGDRRGPDPQAPQTAAGDSHAETRLSPGARAVENGLHPAGGRPASRSLLALLRRLPGRVAFHAGGGRGGRGALLRGPRDAPGEPRPDDRDDLGADQPRHLPDDRPLGGFLLRQPVSRLPPAADPGPAAYRPDRPAPRSHDRRGAPSGASAPVPGDGPVGDPVLRGRPVDLPVDVAPTSFPPAAYPSAASRKWLDVPIRCRDSPGQAAIPRTGSRGASSPLRPRSCPRSLPVPLASISPSLHRPLRGSPRSALCSETDSIVNVFSRRYTRTGRSGKSRGTPPPPPRRWPRSAGYTGDPTPPSPRFVPPGRCRGASRGSPGRPPTPCFELFLRGQAAGDPRQPLVQKPPHQRCEVRVGAVELYQSR